MDVFWIWKERAVSTVGCSRHEYWKELPITEGATMMDYGTGIGISIGIIWGVVMFHYMGIFDELRYFVEDFP
jgi:hypothetical protein